MKKALNLWLEEKTHQSLQEEAQKICGSRGQVVRLALKEYFQKLKGENQNGN